MRMLCTVVAALALWWAAPSAKAEDVQTAFQRHWAGGSMAQAERDFANAVWRAPNDTQARLAFGVTQMFRAFEKLSQALYRHGVDPQIGALLGPGFNGASLVNTSPRPLSPSGLRDILANFVADLDRARASLAQVKSETVKLRIDLTAVRLDLDADGRADPPPSPEQVRAYFGRMAGGMPPPDSEPQEAAEPFAVALDLADARWLQGYANLIAAPFDFLLAHDLEPFYIAIGHRLFPQAGFPLQRAAQATSADEQFTGADTVFADAIAAAHLMRGRVVEPQRRARVRTRLLETIALSRETFALIARETDDDNEWLPNTQQTNRFSAQDSDFAMTQERIDGWLVVLKTAEDVLEGRALMPHWRFQQGLSVKALLQGREDFDLVLLLTGSGALPYLRDGPLLNEQRLRALGRPFGDNFLPFALWFN